MLKIEQFWGSYFGKPLNFIVKKEEEGGRVTRIEDLTVPKIKTRLDLDRIFSIFF